MNIGIDIDGVMFDTESYFRTLSFIKHMENGGEKEANREESDYKNRLGWDEKMEEKFIDENFYEIEMNAPFMPYAEYIFQKLKLEGHRLVMITARGYYNEKEVEITKKRLKEVGMVFDKECYFAEDKVKVCVDENIDLMIDDNYYNIERISSAGIKCLYFRDMILKNFNDIKNIHEVRNWADIYYEIKNINKW